MSRYADGIDSIRSLAERLRGLTDLANVLSELGSLENAIIERKRELDKANAELTDARKQTAAAYEERKQHGVAMDDANAAHDKKCREMTEQARYEAEAIIKAAQRDADEIRAVAARDAQHAREVHAEDIVNLNATREAIEAEIRDAEERLNELNAQHDELSEKAARVREHIRNVAKSV